MVKISDLVTAIAETLARVPELVAVLEGPDPITPYLDRNPTANSVENAIYQMQPGQLLVMWTDTNLIFEAMSKWSHKVEICVRAGNGQSDLDVVALVMQGVPVPGDGMIWRLCPVLPGLLPTDVVSISRRTDSEGVDYAVIATETAETGDWPYP